jgi:ATP-dependent Lon protease
MLDGVPGPLLDRMEIISLAGYTEDEKLEIARRYLVRRQLEANGLTAQQAEIEPDALRLIIRGYTREAGVRNLEREIGKALRNVAVQVAEGSASRVVITANDIPALLGQPRFENEVAMRTAVPGVATGLAWTPVGGDILFIEASKVPGSGKLIITGQLGDVMKESAQAALTLARTYLNDAFDKQDIHIHVPAGATPKDGPSAGVAMFLALTSLLTGTPVRADVAMTGEISLRGAVLPVGGIKEKMLAAHRAGIKRILMPERNQKDMIDVPDQAKKEMEFFFIKKIDEILPLVLTELPEKFGKAGAGGGGSVIVTPPSTPPPPTQNPV